ncbi:MAG TPA: phosphoribosylaminoimidazolesuccinocarboxamide synthase [Syntrophomonadaceae bacterium]|nr:phosphoribosylaminoimidazolesuccinocarboxamide synthase [Syntrophomonadaceae bacterium]HPR92896.1 phosphoribosylaminoimidazolesuccinocarboxamide synthase [Syntrophomonadaceae bacterium]
MEKKELLYEGKAKQIYAVDDDRCFIMTYKDEATAFDGAKKGIIENKGIVNNRISCLLFKMLEAKGIKTHLVKQLDERNVLVRRMQMLPLEVVVRNVAAGSLAKRLGIEEGGLLKTTVVELYYKNDDLHDPMVNEYHAVAMGWADREQLKEIQDLGLKINEILKSFFDDIGIILVDFKLEFGISEGKILLGDEISPDSCRLWDKTSLEKLDKDRFRRDLGGEAEAYQEVVGRIEKYFAGVKSSN